MAKGTGQGAQSEDKMTNDELRITNAKIQSPELVYATILPIFHLFYHEPV
jgi:hypothetical protein